MIGNMPREGEGGTASVGNWSALLKHFYVRRYWRPLTTWPDHLRPGGYELGFILF